MVMAETNGITKAGHVREKLVQLISYAETVLTPLYVKTLVQAAWMIPWRARKSVMTRW